MRCTWASCSLPIHVHSAHSGTALAGTRVRALCTRVQATRVSPPSTRTARCTRTRPHLHLHSNASDAGDAAARSHRREERREDGAWCRRYYHPDYCYWDSDTPCAPLSLVRLPIGGAVWHARIRLPHCSMHLSQHFRSRLEATYLIFGTQVNGWALSPTACHSASGSALGWTTAHHFLSYI